MCYKIVFGLVKLEFLEFFVTAPVTITSGHPYRLFVNLAKYNVRKDFLQTELSILVLLIVLRVILIKLIISIFLLFSSILHVLNVF